MPTTEQRPAQTVCARCGEVFTPKRTGPVALTCSAACRVALFRRKFPSGRMPVGTTVEGTCASCGAPFTFVHRRRPRTRCYDCRP